MKNEKGSLIGFIKESMQVKNIKGDEDRVKGPDSLIWKFDVTYHPKELHVEITFNSWYSEQSKDYEAYITRLKQIEVIAKKHFPKCQIYNSPSYPEKDPRIEHLAFTILIPNP